MSPKDIEILGLDDKEVINFLERARAANGLRVQIGPDVFMVKVASETVQDSGRAFLTNGSRFTD